MTNTCVCVCCARARGCLKVQAVCVRVKRNPLPFPCTPGFAALPRGDDLCGQEAGALLRNAGRVWGGGVPARMTSCWSFCASSVCMVVVSLPPRVSSDDDAECTTWSQSVCSRGMVCAVPAFRVNRVGTSAFPCSLFGLSLRGLPTARAESRAFVRSFVRRHEAQRGAGLPLHDCLLGLHHLPMPVVTES